MWVSPDETEWESEAQQLTQGQETFEEPEQVSTRSKSTSTDPLWQGAYDRNRMSDYDRLKVDVILDKATKYWQKNVLPDLRKKRFSRGVDAKSEDLYVYLTIGWKSIIKS